MSQILAWFFIQKFGIMTKYRIRECLVQNIKNTKNAMNINARNVYKLTAQLNVMHP